MHGVAQTDKETIDLYIILTMDKIVKVERLIFFNKTTIICTGINLIQNSNLAQENMFEF